MQRLTHKTENPEARFDLCEQRQSILNGSGHMLIVGGPGSGKTTIALLKGRRAVLELLRPEQSALFLSFSNAAIRRIMESGGNILSREVGRQVEVKTYHSFAWEILRSHGYLLSRKRNLSVVGAHDAAVLKAGLTKADWIHEEQRLFMEEGRVTYDQFAPHAADLLERSYTVRTCFCNAYPVILVDEFQDTDEDQWRLVRAMSEQSEIIALGDSEQRIYSWREGVSETRLQEYVETLGTKTFDFREENNRSPATGIVSYARSLLSPKIRAELPNDIVCKHFLPGRFQYGLRFAFNQTWKETKKRTERSDLSIAVAARSRAMIRKISDELTKTLTVGDRIIRPVQHDVMFDEMQTTLASKVVAFIMESNSEPQNLRLAGTLERISALFRSYGNKTAINTSDKLLDWSQRCRISQIPKTKCVKVLTALFEDLDSAGFSGSPTQDWLLVRRSLEGASANELQRAGEHARYLRFFRRGSAIETRLSELWIANGSYIGAEVTLNKAIVQDQIVDSHMDLNSVSVMTMHQLKAREYDGVLLVEDRYRSFRGKDAKPPFMDTRRLLQVSLTRARNFVCILSEKHYATLDKILVD